MAARSRERFWKLTLLTSVTLVALSTRAYLRQPDDVDCREFAGGVALPTGQYVTPTMMDDAVQQYLNPHLAAYPNFVAGEAVRSQLSPDGTTLTRPYAKDTLIMVVPPLVTSLSLPSPAKPPRVASTFYPSA